jgi:hypothetical protein
MSRNRLTRALITLASLLGAIPLMAQQPAITAPAFPYGRYALMAIDTLHGPPPGIEVEFTPSEVKVFRGEQQVESHTVTFMDGRIQFFQLGGECTDTGDYSWQVSGGYLELTQVSDPCRQRSQSIMAVHFKKL